MFRTVSLSIVRSFSLYTQQCYMSYIFSWQLANRIMMELVCVQWKTPNDVQRNCPKYVEFFSKNKFEKLLHLFGFIIRMYLYSFWIYLNPLSYCSFFLPTRINLWLSLVFATTGLLLTSSRHARLPYSFLFLSQRLFIFFFDYSYISLVRTRKYTVSNSYDLLSLRI